MEFTMRSGILVCALAVLMCLPAFSKAQTIAIEYEYQKKINAANELGSLNSTAFGNSTDDATGRTVFSNTDIDLPGNNALAVRLGRRLSIDYRYFDQELGGIGNWDIEVPYIEGTFSKLYGWSVAPTSSPNRYKRCSYPNAPMVQGGVFLPHEVSHGYKIHVPGLIDDSLGIDTTAFVDPTDGKQYPWILKSMGRLGCLPSLKTGQPGEGFVLLTTGGVKYYFDYMVERKATTLRKGPKGCHGFDSLCHSMSMPRTRIFLLATRAEDRFGNYVDYSYNGGRLASISASDGRQITIQYATNSITATASGRSWSYTLQNGHLVTVTNPDNSKWHYPPFGLPTYVSGWEEGIAYMPPESFDPDYECTQSPSMYIAGNYFQVTHPSGALAKFSFTGMNFGRSHVMYACSISYITGDIGFANITTPNYFGTYSLSKLEVSGPGVPQQTTNFQYDSEFYPYCDQMLSATGEYITARCHEPQCANGECVDPVGRWVNTTRPDGSKHRKRFGVIYGVNEGRLLAEQVLDAAGNVLRQMNYEYIPDTAFPGQAFAPDYGILPTGTDPIASKVRPLIRSEIIEGGVTFKSEVPLCTGSIYCFDGFARSTMMRRFNTLGSSKTEVIEYHDNLDSWVLGQIKRVHNAQAGLVMSHTDYNAQALPWKTYRFGKLQQTLSYWPDGNVNTVTDGRNNTISLGDYYRGIPRLISHPPTPESPAGATESATVDLNGWITSVTDEIGAKTCYGYDPMGRLSSIVYPSESQLGVCDDSRWSPVSLNFVPVNQDEHGLPAGHWRASRHEGDKRVNTYYDALWRPVLEEAFDASNVAATVSQVVKKYDASGRLSFQSYPANNVDHFAEVTQGTRTLYDALDRVTRVEQDSEHGVLATTTEYLANLQARVVNPRGFATVTAFMSWDQPTYDLPIASVQPEGKVIEIARDPQFGWPLQLKQRSADNSVQQVRSYVYDEHAQLCKTIEPEAGATVMHYDAAGNLDWSAAGLGLPGTTSCDDSHPSVAARKATRSYDPRNRLTHLRFPDGRGNQVWTYEKDSLPASVTAYNDPDSMTPVVTAYAYNKRRLLTGESSSQPNWYTWGIGYDYDPVGNLRWQSYPTGLVLDYAPNALGQPTQVRDQYNKAYASGAQYFPNGALKQFTYGNGIVHTMHQNARQLPQRVTSSGGTLDFSYSYDNNANVDSIWDHARDSGNGFYGRWMTYDGLDRLTSAGSCTFGGDCWHRFTYDALDNMKSWKLGGVKDYADYIYEAQTNRLTSIRNTAGATIMGLDYGAQGNLENKNGQAYVFDYGNRLRQVAGKEAYRYDGLGRRVLTWRPAGVAGTAATLSLFQYSQSGQLMYEEHSDKPNGVHAYLAGSLVATRHGDGSVKYQHTDALGSPVAVTNEAGQVIERNDYEPYGAIIGKPARSGIGYTGHVMDGLTGLTYMQQRYYDQSLGRFLSVDPVTANGNTGAMFNRYDYAHNNPYKFIDPDGRESACFSNGYGCGLRPTTDADRAKIKFAMGGMAATALAFISPAAARQMLVWAGANSGTVATATTVAADSAGVTGAAGATAGLASIAGFKYGVSAAEIIKINKSFSNGNAYREVGSVLANADRYTGFYNKVGSIIRDIAGGHLFENGNKRTAVEVTELLISKNGVDGPPKELIWKAVDGAAEGKLNSVTEISKTLQGK
jgi:RHS repeat-associated protein